MSRSTRPRASSDPHPLANTSDADSVESSLRQPWVQRFALILALGLIPQAVVAYYHLTWVSDGGFYYGTFLARVLALPAAALLLRMPPHALGLGRPRLRRREIQIGGALLTVGTLVAIALLQMDSYQNAYEYVREGDVTDRFVRWFLFTSSTTVSWEALHRGLLLFGTRHVLRQQPETRATADAFAIGITAVFEVLFHFRKPPLEAVAMMFGSPLLSWIGLRQNSLWIPLILHLWVETLFFALVWL
jgi:membrane protease YdiL (CAAX protease family)